MIFAEVFFFFFLINNTLSGISYASQETFSTGLFWLSIFLSWMNLQGPLVYAVLSLAAHVYLV